MRVIDVAAGIIWQSGRFLAAKRSSGKMGAGLWEFPGGKLESGETASEALQRELAEELSITLEKYYFWQSQSHIYPEYKVNLHFFHITAFQGKPRCLPMHSEIAWLLPTEALLLPFLPADVAVLQELAEGGANFATITSFSPQN